MPAEQPSHLVSKVETRLPFGRSGERGAGGGTDGPGVAPAAAGTRR